MERDQYQHWLPRFILRPFSKDDIINIYTLPSNTTSQQDLNKTFGGKNFYRSTTGDEIEKLLMDLETDTSRAFSEMKKEAELSGDDGEDCTVILSDKDILSIKKFFIVSSIRTELYRDCMAQPHGFMATTPSIEKREDWINVLKVLLKSSSETLLGYEKATRPIELYQIISNMQLYIWKKTGEEEFLLGGDHLVHHEGMVRYTNDRNKPKVAHLLLPISPSVVVAACDSLCCQQASMLSKYQHVPPREHTLPGRKKPGQKGYRPPRNVWIYPITNCEEQQMFIINTRVFSSTQIVFRTYTAFRKLVDRVVATQRESDFCNRPITKICEDDYESSQPNLTGTTGALNELLGPLHSFAEIGTKITEDSQLRTQVIRTIICISYAVRFYTSKQSSFEN